MEGGDEDKEERGGRKRREGKGKEDRRRGRKERRQEKESGEKAKGGDVLPTILKMQQYIIPTFPQAFIVPSL